VAERRGLSVRPFDLRRFAEEVGHVKRLFRAAWSENWGFVAPTDREIAHIAAGLRSVLDPDLCCFCERAGEPIGFAIILPDPNVALQRARPHPDTAEWWTRLRLLWHWKVRRSIPTAVGFLGGVIQSHRGGGASALMAVYVAEALLKKGYRYFETARILEHNAMMRRLAEAGGGKVHRTYHLYQKAL
jgi:hypothetical protein